VRPRGAKGELEGLAGRPLTPARPGHAWQFRPFHFADQHLPLNRLEACEAITYSPLKEYGGWGIRLGAHGMAYNVSGNRGVRLRLKGGEQLLLGSQRPEELAAALDAAATW
jgi:hypothetical protein